MPSWLSKKTLLTFGVSILGALAFRWAGLPLPFLFGPMSACLLVALAGAQLGGFGPVNKGARTILGVAVGTSITPQVLSELPQMAGSVALVPIYVAVIAAIGVPFFHRVCRFDPVTSFYAAMPGGLQDMIVFGVEAGGNARILSLLHATRVLVVVTLAPILLTWLFGAGLTNPSANPRQSCPWMSWA